MKINKIKIIGIILGFLLTTAWAHYPKNFTEAKKMAAEVYKDHRQIFLLWLPI